MIELAPIETARFCDSEVEAILYCSFLKIGDCINWRLPTHEEFVQHQLPSATWYQNRPDVDSAGTHLKFNGSYWDNVGRVVRAVRDIDTQF